MKKFSWIIYLLPVLLSAQNQTVITVDRFDRFPVNDLNQEVAGFFSEAATIKLQTVSNNLALGNSGSSLAIEYNVEIEEAFCGITFPLDNLDLTEAGYLSFWIRGKGEEEYLSVELTGTIAEGQDTVSAKVAIWDYLTCGPTGEWRKISIPIDAFWNLEDRSDILRLTFVFENFQSTTNLSPVHSTIYLDDILFGTKSTGIVKIDKFEDLLKSNATSGNIGEFSQNSNPENYNSELLINDAATCDYDLYITYNNEGGDNFGGVFFILGGQDTGWRGSDRSLGNYENIRFKLRAEAEQTNPGNIKIELKPDQGGASHTYRLLEITTTSKEYNIPLQDFTPPIDDEAIGQLIIVFERNVQQVGEGSLFLEEISLYGPTYDEESENQYPSTPSSITINGDSLPAEVSAESQVDIVTTSVYNSPSIETAFLEYYDGCDWIRFQQKTAPLPSPLSFSFLPTNLIPNRENPIRIGVQSCYGNTTYSDTVVLKVNDSGALTAEQLFRNAYELFRFLRTETGVYNDAAVFEGDQFHPVSVATTGMGLVALCIADSMQWENDAAALVIETLEAINGLREGFVPDRNSLGWFRHFIDAMTGVRAWNSEYSSVDSAILTAGALFCKNYFSDYPRIGELADLLCASILWESMIKDPNTGAIYLTADEQGVGGQYAALPYNEYILVAWLAKNDPRDTITAPLLWDNFYANTDALPKISYDGYEMLTDGPGRYLSGFIPQFSYYLCHPFAIDSTYRNYYYNHMKADRAWWEINTEEACYIWGFGAGAANGWKESGYHADDIGNHPGTICSPHIIAGAIPVMSEGLDHLLQLARDQRSWYNLPESGKKIIWRFSAENPLWKAGDIQGVDYATFLFGIAAYPDFLGREFFLRNNNFVFPDFKPSANQELPRQVSKLEVVPNPFFDLVNFDLILRSSEYVKLTVLSTAGKPVYQRRLGKLSEGQHQITWNGKDSQGFDLPTGAYVLYLQVGTAHISRKVVKVKGG